MAAASADVLLLMTVRRAAHGLGYPGEWSSGGEGKVAPWQGKNWKAERHGVYLELSQLMQHLWEHTGPGKPQACGRAESGWAPSLPNSLRFHLLIDLHSQTHNPVLVEEQLPDCKGR